MTTDKFLELLEQFDDIPTDYGRDALIHFFCSDVGEKDSNAFAGQNFYRFDILPRNAIADVYTTVSEELLNREWEIIHALEYGDKETIQQLWDWIDNLIESNQ